MWGSISPAAAGTDYFRERIVNRGAGDADDKNRHVRDEKKLEFPLNFYYLHANNNSHGIGKNDGTQTIE